MHKMGVLGLAIIFKQKSDSFSKNSKCPLNFTQNEVHGEGGDKNLNFLMWGRGVFTNY